MADRNGYIGRAPSDSSVIIARQTFEPTGVQTNFTFTSGYVVGYLDVYINGARQINASDYTATDGSTVGLTTYATSGDVLELVAYKAFNIATIDSAPGNLSVGSDLTVSGTSNVGVVTGGTYYGDGSNLSGVGVPGVSTTGHSVFNTIKASGITTISATTSSTSTTTGALIVSGGVGIGKSLFVGEGVSVAGTITYADVTNVDSIGIVTAGKGVAVTGAYPITLGTGTTIHQVASNTLTLGTNNAEALRVDSSQRLLLGTTTEGDANADNLTIYGSNNVGVTIRSDNTEACSLFFSDATSGAGEYAGMVQYAHSTNELRLGSSGSIDFQVSSSGSSLMRVNSDGDVNITGICTAASFSGVESWNQQDAWLFSGG